MKVTASGSRWRFRVKTVLEEQTSDGETVQQPYTEPPHVKVLEKKKAPKKKKVPVAEPLAEPLATPQRVPAAVEPAEENQDLSCLLSAATGL